jgi:hypothetical protein
MLSPVFCTKIIFGDLVAYTEGGGEVGVAGASHKNGSNMWRRRRNKAEMCERC